MKTILEDHICYVGFENVPTKAPVIRGWLVFGKHAVEVDALLDIGCDVTFVKAEKIEELESLSGKKIPLKRQPLYINNPQTGAIMVENGFNLSFTFPSAELDECYSSPHGFFAPSNMEFDIADVWLGRDLFNYLKITFDGVNGSVTIYDPLQRGRKRP